MVLHFVSMHDEKYPLSAHNLPVCLKCWNAYFFAACHHSWTVGTCPCHDSMAEKVLDICTSKTKSSFSECQLCINGSLHVENKKHHEHDNLCAYTEKLRKYIHADKHTDVHVYNICMSVWILLTSVHISWTQLGLCLHRQGAQRPQIRCALPKVLTWNKGSSCSLWHEFKDSYVYSNESIPWPAILEIRPLFKQLHVNKPKLLPIQLTPSHPARREIGTYGPIHFRNDYAPNGWITTCLDNRWHPRER